ARALADDGVLAGHDAELLEAGAREPVLAVEQQGLDGVVAGRIEVADATLQQPLVVHRLLVQLWLERLVTEAQRALEVRGSVEDAVEANQRDREVVLDQRMIPER